MVQIQFLDKDIVAALVPTYSMKPERVVFLYDTREVSENNRKEVMEALKVRLPKLHVQYERTNMLSMEEIKVSLEKVIKSFQSKEIQIDITGGTELMTACGLMAAKEYDLTPTYVDFYSEQIRNVFTMERMGEICHVTLADYLTSIGGKLMSSSHHTPKESDFERILSMAKIVFSNEKKWDKFFAHMTKGYSAKGVMEFSMDKDKNDRDCQFMLDAFLDKGFAKKIGEDRYRFSSEADKEYMTVSGIWLEMYMYIQAKKCYEDVYLGAEIDWNKRDICTSRDNEIDVVVMRKSQPIFISCKMRPIEKETVYEVYSMAKRLSGNYGKSMIATTIDVRATKDIANGLYMRMEKMKVGLIEEKDFNKKSATDVFANALRMTE